MVDNIRIEKDIVISMTKELGIKVFEVMNSSLNCKDKISESIKNDKIIENLKNIEIKEAFELENKR